MKSKTRKPPAVKTKKSRSVLFVLVRVISWIALFGDITKIHEITRSNTNRNGEDFLGVEVLNDGVQDHSRGGDDRE